MKRYHWPLRARASNCELACMDASFAAYIRVISVIRVFKVIRVIGVIRIIRVISVTSLELEGLLGKLGLSLRVKEIRIGVIRVNRVS
jgi:hypothetical protein